MSDVQLVAWAVNDEEYAVEIQEVQEIIRLVPITRMPYSPECLPGVINLRGRVIPVIDMAKRLQLPDLVLSDLSRIIIVNCGDSLVGLMVDRVSEVLKLPLSCIESYEVLSPDNTFRFAKGIGKFDGRVLLILDLDKIFEMENNLQF